MGAPKGTKPWNYGTSKGWVDKRGYRWTLITEDGKRRARREHRAVMEAHLGRKLEPWELVHHRDGDKLNNEVSNLEVTEFGVHTTDHHLGARRPEAVRRSIEAFAHMREALSRERAINADLYEALAWFINDIDGTHTVMLDFDANVEKARAALARARGDVR